MRRLLFAGTIGAALVGALVVGSFAAAKGDKGSANARAQLDGYQEVPSLSTAARGTFRAKINKEANTIDYTLEYSGIEGGTATAAHIHLGQRATNGGVAAFLCGGGGKPACPATGGTVSGTIAAGDVLATMAGTVNQGIAAGEIAELIRAIRAGATYANVHSSPTWPGGEIRGQIRGGGWGRGKD